MTFRLTLAAGGQQSVAIGRKATKTLQSHQKNAIRFLFDAYVKSQHGAILTVDEHMNHEHTCAVGLSAIYKSGRQNLPSVILCKESRYWYWFDSMKRYSDLDVFKLTENNADRLLSRNEALILIVTDKEHAILRNYVKDYQFCVLVADEVDMLCEKLITKQVQADFHLGFTHRNFITDPDQQLRWKIINWALKKANKQLAKFVDFKEYDDAYLQIKVDAYAEFWEVFTWDLCTAAEIAQNQQQRGKLLHNIQLCQEAHGLNDENKSKRKHDSNPTTPRKDNRAKRTRTTRKRPNSSPIIDNYVYWSSDEEAPPDLSVFEISIIPNVRKSPSTLRLKSPKRNPSETLSNEDFQPKTSHKRLHFDSVAKPTQTITKTKSLIVDPVIVDEFSKPFDVSTTNNLNNLQVSKSDSALLGPQESNEEFCDAEVLREFSRDLTAKLPACNDALDVLLTGELAKHADVDSDLADTLNLYLSDTNQEMSEAACAERVDMSSDEDLDACLAKFIYDAKSLSLPSNKSTEMVFSGKPNSQHIENTDEDTEIFLRGLLCKASLESDVSHRNVINYADSSDESFVLAFL